MREHKTFLSRIEMQEAADVLLAVLLVGGGLHAANGDHLCQQIHGGDVIHTQRRRWSVFKLVQRKRLRCTSRIKT